MYDKNQINKIYKQNTASAKKILTKLDLKLYALNPDWVAINHLGKDIKISNLLMERLAYLFSIPWKSIYQLEDKLKSNEQYLKNINKIISYNKNNNLPTHKEYFNYRNKTKKLIKYIKKEINLNLKL